MKNATNKAIHIIKISKGCKCECLFHSSDVHCESVGTKELSNLFSQKPPVNFSKLRLSTTANIVQNFTDMQDTIEEVLILHKIRFSDMEIFPAKLRFTDRH